MGEFKYGKILDLDEIRCLMADRKISQVARRTGLNQNTIYRLLWGTAKPTYETLKILTEYLTAAPGEILRRYKGQNEQEAF